MRYEIWDKKSDINGVSAQKFIEMMGYCSDDEIYIIYNDNRSAWIVQTFINAPYSGNTIEEKAKTHFNVLKGSLSINE